MAQTLIGILMVVLTAAGFYWVARNRYKCPYCARPVRWDDVNCRHCGADMKFLHRAGPQKPPKAASRMTPPSRSRRK